MVRALHSLCRAYSCYKYFGILVHLCNKPFVDDKYRKAYHRLYLLSRIRIHNCVYCLSYIQADYSANS